MEKGKRLKRQSIIWDTNIFLYSSAWGMLLMLFLINQINLFMYLGLSVLIGLALSHMIKERDKITIELYKYKTYKVV